MPERLGLSREDSQLAERRVLETYRKFRDVWEVLKGVREGFGGGGMPVDRFIRNDDYILADLLYLKEQGIRNLVTLTERPLEPEHLESTGVDSLHIPVGDMRAPEMPQLQTFVEHVDACLKDNRPVAVHCLAGIGRTGTFLACYLVYCGATAEQAIVEVRTKRPESIESEKQEQAVHQFEGLRNL